MSRKVEAATAQTNQLTAEILAMQAQAKGELELRDQFTGLSQELGESAIRQAAWHEQEVKEVQGGMTDQLQDAIKFPPTPDELGRAERRLLDARSSDVVEEGIQSFYDLLDIAGKMEEAKPKTFTAVMGVGQAARQLVQRGTIDSNSKLAKISIKNEGHGGPTWRMRRKEVPTGTGFSIRETRYSTNRRTVGKHPDMVEVDIVFDKPKKNSKK